MKQVGDMKLYTLDEVLDESIGKKGTPARDEFDRKVEEQLLACRIGEAMKNARLKQNLTREELAERIGMKKARISRMEKGYGISIPAMSRVLKALGVATATLDMGAGGKVALW